ncbi:MAG: DNA-directed RNA polymerase subunit L [Candidatus Thorarchaeota archaeon]|nr:MAG: DNA-directed RNA polymerase subunit L [Candidatus Thorarchaeota archaeon]RLI56188.1 MAG: DNA-directed RNA polymerase subunit L [Candidatus Thorarchaeota archaeon]RLI62491.1 MAG: DNA-directed RNA polymerase subunit L [Candidatus Thorarchaeota archaeon]
MEPRVLESSRYELKIEIVGEGHSFCNLLRKTLLEEPAVEFAGYSIDHPLLANPVFTLRTKRRQANVVLREALEKMLARTEEFRKKFVQAVSDHEVK